MRLATGSRRSTGEPSTHRAGRPILLVTMGVPLEETAGAFAVDSSVETGQDLIVANVTRLEPLSLSIVLGYDALEEFTPEVSASLRRWSTLAASLGVHVERLRIRSPRPVTALLELVGELAVGLVVFGPDRRVMGARAYGRALRRIRVDGVCPIWAPAPA